MIAHNTLHPHLHKIVNSITCVCSSCSRSFYIVFDRQEYPILHLKAITDSSMNSKTFEKLGKDAYILGMHIIFKGVEFSNLNKVSENEKIDTR